MGAHNSGLRIGRVSGPDCLQGETVHDSKGSTPDSLTSTPIVYILDQDPAYYKTLVNRLGSQDLDVAFFDRVDSFLRQLNPEREGCVVAEVNLPTLCGVELLYTFKQRSIDLPVIVIGHDTTVPSVVQAMQAGAVTFIEKPLDFEHLHQAIDDTIRRHRGRCQQRLRRHELRARFQSLSESENDVLQRMVDGKPNKVIAADLDMGLRTVELRRARILTKMEVDSVAALVRLTIEMYRLESAD